MADEKSAKAASKTSKSTTKAPAKAKASKPRAAAQKTSASDGSRAKGKPAAAKKEPVKKTATKATTAKTKVKAVAPKAKATKAKATVTKAAAAKPKAKTAATKTAGTKKSATAKTKPAAAAKTKSTAAMAKSIASQAKEATSKAKDAKAAVKVKASTSKSTAKVSSEEPVKPKRKASSKATQAATAEAKKPTRGRKPAGQKSSPSNTDTLFPETVETIEKDGRKVAADFKILGLHEGVQRALDSVNYKKPTEVQALCLPHTVEGRDVAGFAQTGTGKTAVFLITASHRILSEEITTGENGSPSVLVLVPTRELAAQIQHEADTIFKELGIKAMAVFGGSSDIEKQKKALSNKVDVVIATPGRLFDLYRQHAISFDNVGLLVCDEADRMLDMGFVDDVEKVLTLIPERSQKLLFSATGSTKVHELAFEFLNKPEYIETTPETVTPENITQWCYATRAEEKFPVLLSSMREEAPECAIVFTNTKVVAEWVAYKLSSNGIEAEALTGDIPQNRRMALIKAIKNGELKVIVATDVLSRGLHVTGLSHVYNFDIPDEAESFIHRIGRTARAGAKGSAVTLICEDYGYNMGAVEELLGFSVEMKSVPKKFLEVEDKSDFPFDSSGRVKSTRSLKGATGEDESAQTDSRESGRPQESRQKPEARDESRRPSSDTGSRRAAQPQRSEPADDAVQARERDQKAIRDERYSSSSDSNVSEDSRSQRPSSRDDRYNRSSESRPQRRDEQPRSDSRYASDSRPETSSRTSQEESREKRFTKDTRQQPSQDTRSRASADTRSRPSPTQPQPPRESTQRESKFVRRDERAKEVIEAALLAAARERELLRVASLKEEVQQLSGILDPAVAKRTAQKVGEGLVATIRKAAPGLGGFFKKLGKMLDEEPQESVVRTSESTREQRRERPQAPRSSGRQRHSEDERDDRESRDSRPPRRTPSQRNDRDTGHDASRRSSNRAQERDVSDAEVVFEVDGTPSGVDSREDTRNNQRPQRGRPQQYRSRSREERISREERGQSAPNRGPRNRDDRYSE